MIVKAYIKSLTTRELYNLEYEYTDCLDDPTEDDYEILSLIHAEFINRNIYRR